MFGTRRCNVNVYRSACLQAPFAIMAPAVASVSAARPSAQATRSACDGWGAGAMAFNYDHCESRMVNSNAPRVHDLGVALQPTCSAARGPYAQLHAMGGERSYGASVHQRLLTRMALQRCTAARREDRSPAPRLTSRHRHRLPLSAGPRAEYPPPFRISPDCPEWYERALAYPFYYQDDPNADDLPSSLSSYINGFETRGRSYCRIDELRAMPLDISQLEICAPRVGQRGLVPGPASPGLCTMHRDQWLEHAQPLSPLWPAHAADRSNSSTTSPQTRSQFYRGGFYANGRACRAGRRPPAMRTRVGRAPAAAKVGATIRSQVRLLGTFGAGVADNARATWKSATTAPDQTRVHRAAAVVAHIKRW